MLGAPVQIAYSVDDAVEAAHRWAALGAGPFFVNPHIPVRDAVYLGQSIEFDHTSAYGQWGNVMIELVQDHTIGPSPVAEFGVNRLHHMAFFVDDLDVATDRLPYHCVFRATAGGGTRFLFLDATATHDHYFELYARSDRLLGFYEMVATAARGWDGTKPVRILG